MTDERSYENKLLKLGIDVKKSICKADYYNSINCTVSISTSTCMLSIPFCMDKEKPKATLLRAQMQVALLCIDCEMLMQRRVCARIECLILNHLLPRNFAAYLTLIYVNATCILVI